MLYVQLSIKLERLRQMRNKATYPREFSSMEQLEKEQERRKCKNRYKRAIRSILYAMVIISTVATLVTIIWMSVLQICGTSMIPTLNEGDILISFKGSDLKSGDIVAFYISDKILVKRCIAGPGQVVDIDENGNVYVDSKLLDETYLIEKAFGECDIKLPYQVPDNYYFCMGDQRSTSVDSRHTSVGCISNDQIMGKIVFRVWPLSDFGTLW